MRVYIIKLPKEGPCWLFKSVSFCIATRGTGLDWRSHPDNENRNSPDPSTQEYFAQLESQYREGGVVIPLYVLLSGTVFVKFHELLHSVAPTTILACVRGSSMVLVMLIFTDWYAPCIALRVYDLNAGSSGRLPTGLQLLYPSHMESCHYQLPPISRGKQPERALVHARVPRRIIRPMGWPRLRFM